MRNYFPVHRRFVGLVCVVYYSLLLLLLLQQERPQGVFVQALIYSCERTSSSCMMLGMQRFQQHRQSTFAEFRHESPLRKATMAEVTTVRQQQRRQQQQPPKRRTTVSSLLATCSDSFVPPNRGVPCVSTKALVPLFDTTTTTMTTTTTSLLNSLRGGGCGGDGLFSSDSTNGNFWRLRGESYKNEMLLAWMLLKSMIQPLAIGGASVVLAQKLLTFIGLGDGIATGLVVASVVVGATIGLCHSFGWTMTPAPTTWLSRFGRRGRPTNAGGVAGHHGGFDSIVSNDSGYPLQIELMVYPPIANVTKLVVGSSGSSSSSSSANYYSTSSNKKSGGNFFGP